MKRRKAREYVLQFLFQSDFGNKSDIGKSLNQFWADKEKDAEVKKFATEIIKGALSDLDEIDSVINKSAEHWVIQRMAAVDRNILRFAVYELLHRKDIPAAVTINEAIEIAKRYSTSESAAFINGILDKIAKGTKSQQKKGVMGMNYAVISDGKIEIVRVEYDIEKTQQKMREAGLPLQLINRLGKGIEGIIEGI